jgi:hypothetical protein
MRIVFLFLLLFVYTTKLYAQSNTNPPADVSSFRQYLAQAEAARQQRLALFLSQKTDVRRDFTDAKAPITSSITSTKRGTLFITTRAVTWGWPSRSGPTGSGAGAVWV